MQVWHDEDEPYKRPHPLYRAALAASAIVVVGIPIAVLWWVL